MKIYRKIQKLEDWRVNKNNISQSLHFDRFYWSDTLVNGTVGNFVGRIIDIMYKYIQQNVSYS